jgi:hypothetical protein
MFRQTIWVAIVSLLAAGCGFHPYVDKPGNPSAPPLPVTGKLTHELQFNDLPVPRHFLFDAESSSSFALANNPFRWARLRYYGTLEMSRTEAFYKDQMPLSGWDLVYREGDAGPVRMEFSGTGNKSNERCTVNIERKGRKTWVELHLRPEQQPASGK